MMKIPSLTITTSGPRLGNPLGDIFSVLVDFILEKRDILVVGSEYLCSLVCWVSGELGVLFELVLKKFFFFRVPIGDFII